jgi:hypothetical protein
MMNENMKDLLRALNAHGVKYLVIGGVRIRSSSGTESYQRPGLIHPLRRRKQ